jgi:hypothetical protein
MVPIRNPIEGSAWLGTIGKRERLFIMKQDSRSWFTCALLVVIGCLFAGPAVPVYAVEISATSPCRVVNLMPQFWKFWDAAKDQPLSAQLSLFNEMVVRKYPEVYRESVLRPGHDDSDLTTRIAGFLMGVPANIAAIRKLNDSLETDLPAYLGPFKRRSRTLRARTLFISSSRWAPLMEASGQSAASLHCCSVWM